MDLWLKYAAAQLGLDQQATDLIVHHHRLHLKHNPTPHFRVHPTLIGVSSLSVAGPCGGCSELYYDFFPERGTAGADLEDDSRHATQSSSQSSVTHTLAA